MSPGDILKALRARGYTVRLNDNGTVTATGVQPKDPERAAKMLADNQASLRSILEAEQVLGAVLK